MWWMDGTSMSEGSGDFSPDRCEKETGESAVWKPKFATEYSFESSWRECRRTVRNVNMIDLRYIRFTFLCASPTSTIQHIFVTNVGDVSLVFQEKSPNMCNFRLDLRWDFTYFQWNFRHVSFSARRVERGNLKRPRLLGRRMEFTDYCFCFSFIYWFSKKYWQMPKLENLKKSEKNGQGLDLS